MKLTDIIDLVVKAYDEDAESEEQQLGIIVDALDDARMRAASDERWLAQCKRQGVNPMDPRI